MKRLVAVVLLIALALISGLTGPAPVGAAPVHWLEVEPTAAGRQWWDEGSLRISKSGTLSVLSRFQPAAAPAATAAAGADAGGGGPTSGRPRILGDLYVMEIDCAQELYRDTSVNGLPRWGAAWEPLGGDGLIKAVVTESCAAAGLQPPPSSADLALRSAAWP
ncbi:MAG: hypothetical protein VKM92_05490 [Cyanobacteriota bacterium]|nr:hypothetical protein [Cyanobacteriota bacterium]